MELGRLSQESPTMPKTRPPSSPDFRRQMVELVRAGRHPEDLAKEFEPTAQSIRYWVAIADRQEGRRPWAAITNGESLSMRTPSLLALAAGLLCLCTAAASAQQYPMLDQIAGRVVQKYQTSSCQQLAAERAHPPGGRRAGMEERV